MTYTLIKFYLLRPQSFSFQIISELIDIFVKFSNFMSQGWTLCSVPSGGLLYIMIVSGGGFLLLSSRVQGVCPSGGLFWMKLIPAYSILVRTNGLNYFVLNWLYFDHN